MSYRQGKADILLSSAEVAKILAGRMAEIEKATEGEAARWEKELQRVDPTLRIVWIDENAKLSDEALEHVVPGRYHICKEVPGQVNEYMALVGPNGEFRIPGSWLLDGGPESLQAADMWNPRVHRHKREAREKIRTARERTRRLVSEQRKDEVALSVRAARRVRSNAGMTTTLEPKRKGEGIKK